MQGDKRQKQQPKMQRMPGNGIDGFGMYGSITPAPGVAQAAGRAGTTHDGAWDSGTLYGQQNQAALQQQLYNLQQQHQQQHPQQQQQQQQQPGMLMGGGMQGQGYMSPGALSRGGGIADMSGHGAQHAASGMHSMHRNSMQQGRHPSTQQGNDSMSNAHMHSSTGFQQQMGAAGQAHLPAQWHTPLAGANMVHRPKTQIASSSFAGANGVARAPDGALHTRTPAEASAQLSEQSPSAPAQVRLSRPLIFPLALTSFVSAGPSTTSGNEKNGRMECVSNRVAPCLFDTWQAAAARLYSHKALEPSSMGTDPRGICNSVREEYVSPDTQAHERCTPGSI